MSNDHEHWCNCVACATRKELDHDEVYNAGHTAGYAAAVRDVVAFLRSDAAMVHTAYVNVAKGVSNIADAIARGDATGAATETGAGGEKP